MDTQTIINLLTPVVRQQFGTVAAFCRHMGRSRAWWTMLKQGKRRLRVEDMALICRTLGVEHRLSIKL